MERGRVGLRGLPPHKHVREFCARWQLPEARPRALPPRYACLPPAHGPEATFFAGNFSKLFPRRREAQRTRRVSVREGKTQLFGLVRVAHVIRGMAMPEGTDPHGFSQKPGGVGNTARRDHLRKGCSGGMEGGAGGETQFPITHPPSPVWKTHHLKSKADLRQARREPRRSDTPALAAFLLKGCKGRERRGYDRLPLRQSEPLRLPHPRG